MPDLEFLTVLSFGFLLGARHALDADHIAAISTILSRRSNLQTSGLIGFSWGFGHTVVLLFMGMVVILLKINIPESLAMACEFGVGVMLVVLGGSLAWTLYCERWHVHPHHHEGAMHLHLHSHRIQADHRHDHWLKVSLRPFLVGVAHGLAGSAALILVVLSTVHTLWEGIIYILVFGIGSIVGMTLLGLFISLPLMLSTSFSRHTQFAVQGLASLGSVGIGLTMMVRITLGESPF
jgi:ABC-type nickel/cobalt efflux system permease component RcnA